MSMDSEGTQDASIFIYTYYILITHAKYLNYYTHVSPVHTNIFLTTLHIYEDCARGVSARIRFIFIPCNRRNYKWLWYLIELCESCNYLRDYYRLFFYYVSFFHVIFASGYIQTGKETRSTRILCFTYFPENFMHFMNYMQKTRCCYTNEFPFHCTVILRDNSWGALFSKDEWITQ